MPCATSCCEAALSQPHALHSALKTGWILPRQAATPVGCYEDELYLPPPPPGHVWVRFRGRYLLYRKSDLVGASTIPEAVRCSRLGSALRMPSSACCPATNPRCVPGGPSARAQARVDDQEPFQLQGAGGRACGSAGRGRLPGMAVALSVNRLLSVARMHRAPPAIMLLSGTRTRHVPGARMICVRGRTI